MKIIAKEIDMIAQFSNEGKITPIRFRLKSEDESFLVFNVEKVLHSDYNKNYGNPYILYKCKISLNGQNRIIEVKYELPTLKWQLFRI